VRLTIKSAGSFLPLLLLLLLESGCTYALWTNGNLVAYKEPDQNPDLHLFQSGKKQDFLVVYNEHSERTDAVHARAYWLNRNQNRVKEQKSPVFTRRSQARHLDAVPVFYAIPGTNAPKGLYAVCDMKQETFTVFSGNHQMGTYDFPIYHDHWGNVEKIALTPVTVTADVTVAGGIAAVWVAYCLGQSGYSFQVGK
jgi:hypothetical protein